MQPDERMNNFMLALQAATDGLQSKMWTAMPGIVEAYDPATQTATIQAAIKPQVLDPTTGKWKSVTLPLFGKVPVAWPGGGGFQLTFPLAKGDEGVVVFAKNCIDAWWQNGGIQEQIEVRQHDLSDAMFVPGLRSVPRVSAPPPSATMPELRSDDGTLSVSIDKDAGIIGLKSPTMIRLDAPLVEITGTFSALNTGGAGVVGVINGGLHATMAIISDADVVGAGTSLHGHIHGGVEAGSSSTDPPT